MSHSRATGAVDRAVTQLAESRYGVFALIDAVPLGLSKEKAAYRVAHQRLWRLYQGVYSIVPPHLLRPKGQWLAAVLACGPDAVLSHTHAAALWQIRHAPSGPIHVTVPTTAGRKRRPGITIHRSSTLLPSQTTVRSAIPVTKPARTLSDLRQLLPTDDWERTRSRALDHHYDLGALGDGAVPSFSELEHRLRGLCRRHSLPSPRAQQVIGPYTVDFLWPDARLVVEVDDFRTHGRRETFESDRERDAWLQLRGWRVVRFTWRQLERRPAEVVAALRGLLDAAA
jgi:very-short-patch-repair endonuclease